MMPIYVPGIGKVHRGFWEAWYEIAVPELAAIDGRPVTWSGILSARRSVRKSRPDLSVTVRSGLRLLGRHLIKGRDRSRLCENAKLSGFWMSLYPSRAATKPIQRDLKGRVSAATRPARVFTQPRPIRDAQVRHDGWPLSGRHPKPPARSAGRREVLPSLRCSDAITEELFHWGGRMAACPR